MAGEDGNEGVDWDGRFDWPNGDPAAYLTGWIEVQSTASDEFRYHIDRLVAARCDPLKIAWLLTVLSDAQRWQSISRETVREAARQLEQAANAVRRLFFSQLHQRLGLDSLRLEGELRGLAAGANELAPHVHTRRPIGRDLNRAALVSYVRQTTGQFHDDDVAALISAAESQEKDHQDPRPDREGGYSTEAHVQWRYRDSAQALLADPPPREIVGLLAAMEHDLRPTAGVQGPGGAVE